MPVLKYKDPITGEVKTAGYKAQIEVGSYVEATMLASNWIDNTYSFETDYPHDEYNLSIEVAPSATTEQFEAFGEAMICGSASSNVVTAINEVPTTDIPIIVKVVAK